MDFIPHSEEDIRAMLRAIGVSSIEELFADIPQKYVVRSLGIGQGKDEKDVFLEALNIAKKNTFAVRSFAGCGVYFHYVPAVCDFVSSLPGFFTAYTPYQAEMSQGVMKLIYDFQTYMTELFDMDVSNAGMYGGASALAEACLMAARIRRKNKIYISAGVNPMWTEVVCSYLRSADMNYEMIPLQDGRTVLKGKFDILVVQYPNFLGIVEDVSLARKSADFLIVAVPDPIDLAILEPPGSFGADISVSEAQPLGNYPYFGGFKLGIFVARSEYIRNMPGRIIGKTEDAESKTCYAMILQTREQHIRREKATSNICTASSLVAIRAAVFLKYYGAEGLRKIAWTSKRNADLLMSRIKPIFQADYLKEFPAYVELNEQDFFSEGYIPPVRLERVIPRFLDRREFEELTGVRSDAFLFCTTELISESDIERITPLIRPL